MSLREKNKRHAVHNRKACNYLSKKSNFSDWVITTAFYSALHFIESMIFPLKDQDGEYESTATYKAAKGIGSEKSVHAVRKQLVRENCDREVKIGYFYLYDASQKARYKDYQVSDDEARMAKSKLKEIESKC